MSDSADDMDYEKDVLKFKQLWKQIKNPSKTNLQTISQKPEKSKKRESKSIKEKKQSKKTTVISGSNIQRNPKNDPYDVIKVVTKPQSSFQDTLRNQKNNQTREYLSMTATNPVITNQVADLKRIIEQRDYQLSLLRVSNSRNEDRIRFLETQIDKRQGLIDQLRARERDLVGQTSDLGSKQFNFSYGKLEYENFKNDTRRLLKMLQTTEEYQQFAILGLDDNGVRFLHQVNKKVKTKLDKPSNSSSFHFCTCNKQFIPQSGFWVPEKVYSFGKQFLKERNGELTQPELQLLLYELNKIWRQREKRIINTLNSKRAKEVGVYKRKIKNLSKEREKSER